MFAISGLEAGGLASVGLYTLVILPFNCSSIYNIFSCTSPWEGTVLFPRSNAIASFTTGVVVVVVHVLHQFSVVSVNVVFHIGHAAVRNFNGISVEIFSHIFRNFFINYF